MARGEGFTPHQSEQIDDAVTVALATMSHRKLDPKALRGLSILIAHLFNAKLNRDKDKDEHIARGLTDVDLAAKSTFDGRAKVVYRAIAGKSELNLTKSGQGPKAPLPSTQKEERTQHRQVRNGDKCTSFAI